MGTQSGYGVTLGIGTTTAADTESEFDADTYTDVGEVSEIGEFGDERTVVEFIALSDGRVKKSRGSSNAGDCVIVYAFDGDDGGQDALKTAFEVVSQSADEFNFRVVFNDSGGTNGTTFYFRAKITSRRVQSISNDNTITVQATLAINSAIIEKAAA